MELFHLNVYMYIKYHRPALASMNLPQSSIHPSIRSSFPFGASLLHSALIGNIFGGDLLRLYHGDECLTIPVREPGCRHE